MGLTPVKPRPAVRARSSLKGLGGALSLSLYLVFIPLFTYCL